MKIMVVDDSKVMRKLVTRAIRQAGFGDAEIVEAEDGAHAVELAGGTPDLDLVLADWNMPNLTGIEMLGRLRELGNPVRVGFVTSESSEEIKDVAFGAGASFFLTKPVDSDEVSNALNGLAV